LGGGEKDFSMLFLYASCDYYLKEGGKLSFLITQEAFKSKGAGEGFRRFQIGERKHLKVLKAHDFVSIQAFDQATNKAAMILLKKGEKTKYPIPYYIWSKKKGTGKIPTNEPLKSVLPFLKKEKFFAKPIQSPTSSWQTISRKQDSNLNIQGKNYYRARQGADPQPYGVFLLNVEAKLMEGYLLVRNLSHSGKFQVPQVEAKIEQDLVYPAVRGADVQRWKVNPKIFILLTQEPIKREPYPEKQMKTDWPWTFSYLLKFKDALLSRSSKSIRDLMERTSFYAMFGVGAYTLSKYKVIWKFMSNDIFATVVSQQKTLFGYKTLVPTKTVAFFPLENEKEAHYLCAIINSKPVRDFIKSFSSAGRGFGTPSVMEHVGIPKFDPKNSLHLRLAEISMECHKLKLENKEKEIEKLEKENDDLVVKLFSSS
ncbi:MAG: hypothetical protein N3A69_08375, partial [Leptospiraceae bacterium]|nr:hypothetical protein [Leptospiraceae bacterium]